MFESANIIMEELTFYRNLRAECGELNSVIGYLFRLSWVINLKGTTFINELTISENVDDELSQLWKELNELYQKFTKTFSKLNDVLNRAHIKNYDLEMLKKELLKIDISEYWNL